MRVKSSNNGLTCQAIAGNHVVLLGWNMEAATIGNAQVLGFAVERYRYSDGETIWLGGMKTFEAVEPLPAPGVPVSSYRHPIQSFQWADYSSEPATRYRYRVVARCGQPEALHDGASVSLEVTTEATDTGRHAVFFNRGAIASQEYARRFQNRKPSKVGPAAYKWLSRGLLEGLLAFIDQAQDGESLHGAIYQFQNKSVFERLRAAKARGVTVAIVYDAKGQKTANENALADSGIEQLVQPRKNSKIAHNKFLVLSRSGAAAEVWTGSTNLTENGIFGHLNNAHIVRDPGVAADYLTYWESLRQDHVLDDYRPIVEGLGPVPVPPAADGGDTVTLFSPRSDLAALDWYADLAAHAERMLCMTFAFGMDAKFVPAYERQDDVLRFALMEKRGLNAAQVATTERIRRLPNTTVAVGAFIPINTFDRWLEEINREIDDNIHVRYVHTKFMLVDPLGDDPIVVVGSANFSKPSCDTNDENMLIIRGNRAIADIYLGEYMRLFSHYAFRESLKFRGARSAAAALQRTYLNPSTDWIDGGPNAPGYFVAGTDRCLRRLYFAGS